MIDVSIKQFNYGYDIDFENGDLAICQDLTTAIYMSIFCEKRADESLIARADLRRGHFTNDFYSVEIGSLFWYYTEQAKVIEENAAELQESIKEGLNWLIDNNYANDVEVSVLIDNNKSNQYNIEIILTKYFDSTTKNSYNFVVNAN
ncbi:MAG: phage GP46 family protein [Rickettsiales bacterium]|jgi:phage gp46-like protein|nr:phage GP46 family protein [Rickettsiales bacterium]